MRQYNQIYNNLSNRMQEKGILHKLQYAFYVLSARQLIEYIQLV